MDFFNKGACLGSDPDLFFPNGDLIKQKKAKAICATCSVINECRDYAINSNKQSGIYGGLSRDERRAYVKLERG